MSKSVDKTKSRYGIETPLEKRKKMPKFTEKYEESLIKQLFEEKTSKLDSIDTTVLQEQKDKIWVHHRRNNAKWDVPIDEEIKYFDPELSYELTGYRPITMEQGLDFDPIPFREFAIKYETTGKYTEFPQGTKPYNEFWKEEYRRCQEGLTINKYRITGDHYFFLNYYRMQTVLEGMTAGSGRHESFPGFLSKQYEFFHYVEMAEKLHKDICILKARGIGLSEIVASLSVRPYTTNPGYNVMITCAAETKLAPLRRKCWKQLDWLNANTQGGMRHVRQVLNNNDSKRASKLTKDGIEFGWLSQITSVVADTSDKVRGDRLDRLIFEECFGKGTKVIMSDFSRKNIEDIKVGDFVMGIDGSPQEVINTCSGLDSLFIVKQNKGEDYVINSKHKIYTEFRPRVGNKPDIIDLITAPEYLALSNYYKRTHYALKSSGLHRTEQSLEINPYFFGAWLGDGISASSEIVINETDDPEIKNFILDYFGSFINDNTYISVHKNSCKTQKILNNYALVTKNKSGSPILKWLKANGLINNKHIPKYIYDISMEDRLSILAGIIDTDGNLKRGSSSYSFTYEISMARKELILQIKELAQSCGFYVNYDERVMHKGYKDGCNAYRIILHGDLRRIPVKVERKKLPDNYTETSNKLSGKFKVEPYGYGEYYGFTLKAYDKDTDHLFLLDDYTIVHNCGSNRVLVDSWIKADALVSLGGIHFGSRIALGTGGDDQALHGLADIFMDPEAFNVLPFKNYDTQTGDPELRAFFIPAHKFALSQEYLDNRGVTDHVRFKEYYLEQRKKLTGDKFLTECAEHCFFPEEALSKTGANVFDSELIAARMAQILTKQDWIEPKRMLLSWDKTADKLYSKVNAFESNHGNILVVEPPMLSEDNTPFKNLYVAGIDAIDQGKDESATDNDVSDFCIVIKKRIRGMDDPKYVAIYKARPKRIREAYETAHKLLVWYNCQAMLEYTKISFQKYLQERKADNLLMKRPEMAMTKRNAKNVIKRLIGVPATEAVINHGLELIEAFLEDYWHTIDFIDILNELLKYTYANKRKFDIVAAMEMAEIGDEELFGLTPAKVNTVESTWVDIGYYRDENGRLQYGAIPKDNKYETRWQN